jgi:ketosteroid isomerase-like protein
MSNDNAELLRGTYEAFGRGDTPAVMAVLAENIVWNTPALLPTQWP